MHFAHRATFGFLALISIAAAACSPQPKAKGPAAELPIAALEDGRMAFDIDIPSDCKITTNEHRLDFQIFRVSCGGVEYAGLYVGNFADRNVPRSRVLTAPYSWPSEVQVWTLEVPNGQDRADKIASSVRVRTSN